MITMNNTILMFSGQPVNTHQEAHIHAQVGVDTVNGCLYACGGFVANSYGESWDSTYEKSRVPVQNQRVRNWKCLGLYVTRQLIWLQNSVLQYTEI